MTVVKKEQIGQGVRVLGMDPALRNFGLALVDVEIPSKRLVPVKIGLIRTEKSKAKDVRHSSSQLRRAEEIAREVRAWETEAAMCAAEIPSGAQSSAAAYGFGVAVGVIGGHVPPLIEVTAREVKLAALEKVSGSKREMIRWAMGNWPHLDWMMHRGKPQDHNEHMADALAAVKAATQTAQFDQAVAMMLSMKGQAA